MGNITEDSYLKKELYELIKTDESIFDFIQESSLDGLWYWDLENLENEWMNSKFWRVLGYNPEEMPHKSSAWQDLINQVDLQAAIENFTKHCENPNHPYDQIVRYTHKNGSTVWIRCRGMAIRDTNGKPTRMLGAHHDITIIKNSEEELSKALKKVEENESQLQYKNEEFKAINEELRQTIEELSLSKAKVEDSENIYRKMNENSPLGMHFYKLENNQLIFTNANPSASRLLKVDNTQFIGKTIEEAFPPLAQTEVPERYREAAEKGIEWFNEQIIYDDKRISGAFEVRAFQTTFGCMVAVFSDITERKQYEQNLQEKNNEIEAQNEEYLQINEELNQVNKEFSEAKERAEESDRLKTAFLQNMSHEIRTPMNAILGFSSLLSENFNNKEKLENFSKIIDLRCNDLLDIINDLLDISKIESGKSTINLEFCNINELFDELSLFFQDCKERLNKQHINLFFQSLPEDSLLIIKTDKLKLKQILINLVSNALKFTETGSVKCECKLESGKLLFQVCDTGIGIPADKFDYVFERFGQLKHTTLQNVGGTGLGLPIVKGLVKLLGGNVWLESECNKGTTFYFTIDYVKADSINAINITTEDKYKIISDITILIVEDDFYNAEYLKEVLKNVTSNVFSVANGLSAINLVKEQKIDLILMDIRLPDISGYEATRLILQDRPNIKIIAQTAYAASSEHQKAIEAGCVDYISKPTKQEQLLKMIKKYLKK